MISLSMKKWILDATVNILTGLLNAEPYSAVIVTLFRRGDELLKELQEMESTQEIEEMALKKEDDQLSRDRLAKLTQELAELKDRLEQSIANEEMWHVCW